MTDHIRNRAKRLLPLALLLLLSGTARAETLAEAVSLALMRFPEVLTARANRDAEAQTIGQARSLFLPSADVSLGQGRERSDNPFTRSQGGGQRSLDRTEAQLTVSQLLFDGGAASSVLKRARSRTESATGQLLNVSETVAFRTAQSFLEVMRLREVLAISEQSVEAHRRTLEQVSSRARGGISPLSDQRQAEARLALAQSSSVQARSQLEQAEAEYRRLTGRAPGQLVAGDSPIKVLPATVRAALDDAIARHPSVRAAQEAVEAANADVEAARARYAPRVTFDLGASRNRSLDGVPGLNADRTAMLHLQSNLFRGGGDSARVAEAQARAESAAAQLAGVRNDIERDVRQAWDILANERARLPALEQHAAVSSDVVDAYRDQFRLGQRTLLDVLNAENERFTARSDYASGRYNIATGVYRLLAAIGRLVPELGLSGDTGITVTTTPGNTP